VVIVSGAGRAFSAGLDLDMREQGVALEFFERQERTRVRLETLDASQLPLSADRETRRSKIGNEPSAR